MGVIYEEEICQIIDNECIELLDKDLSNIQPCPTVNELRYLSIALSCPLRIVKVKREGQLAALAICSIQYVQVNGFSLLTYELFGANLHDYVCLYVADHESFKFLIKALVRDAKKCNADAVYLKNILVPGLDDYLLRKYFTINQTALFIEDGDKLSWNKIISKKSLKRHWNKIKSHPDFRVEHKEGVFTREDVSLLADIHRERWQFEGVSSAFEKKSRIDEYLSYPQNKVITTIYLNSERVCLHFGMKYGSTMLWHTPLINIKYLDYSPLEILLTATAQFCESKNIKTLDFGLGDESYKQRFSNANRFSYETLIPINLKGYLAYFARSTGITKLIKTGVKYSRQKISYITGKVAALKSTVIWFEAIGVQNPVISLSNNKYVVIDNYMSFVDFCRDKNINIYRYQYQRFKDGAVFVALCDNQRALSYGWAIKCSTFKIGEIQRELNFAEAHLFYDFVTPPEFRNKGHYTTLLSNLLRSFPGERLAIFALKKNTASIAAIKKAGFIEISKHRGRLRLNVQVKKIAL